MRLLANPVFLRACVVLILAAFGFLLATIAVRQLRKSISDEADLGSARTTSLETLPLNVYNTVIQQLKQQKHELLVQSQAEHNRARTNDSFSQAVLANLSSGVLVFGANGLVKSSNPAAKTILGFASPTGMSAEAIFRGALVRVGSMLSGMNEPTALAEEVHAVLREGSKRRQVESEYETPAGEKKFLAITVSPVPAVDDGLLGVACLITDRTEIENIRLQEKLHGEISAEMALQLRTSLATISGYAQQLANNRDTELAGNLANDIAHEAAQLERSIGGFLTAKRAAGRAVGSD